MYLYLAFYRGVSRGMDKGLTTSTQSSLLENSLRSDAVTSPTSTLQASPTSGEKASVTGRVLNGFTVLFNKPPKWLVVYALLQNQVLFSLMHGKRLFCPLESL